MTRKTKWNVKTLAVSVPPEDFEALDRVSVEMKVDRSTLTRLFIREGIARLKTGDLRAFFPELPK